MKKNFLGYTSIQYISSESNLIPEYYKKLLKKVLFEGITLAEKICDIRPQKNDLLLFINLEKL